MATYRFFFKQQVSTPARTETVLFLAMILLLFPLAAMGRSFVFNHPVLGSAICIGISILIHLTCFVEFFNGNSKTVTLYQLTHVKDASHNTECTVCNKNENDINEVNNVASQTESINTPTTELAVETPIEEPSREATETAKAPSETDSTTEEAKPRLPKKATFMKQHLLQLFEEEKLYRNDDLNLDMLAERMGVSVNTLSPFISSNFGVPFRTLVNNYRVEAVKGFFLDNPTATQEVVASECGYKDASSLNRKFKEATGVTPLMWLAKHSKA